MYKPLDLNVRFSRPTLGLNNFYKVINGRKYRCNGVVPRVLEEDLRRTFQRHGLVLEVEVDEYDEKMIKLWSRRR